MRSCQKQNQKTENICLNLILKRLKIFVFNVFESNSVQGRIWNDFHTNNIWYESYIHLPLIINSCIVKIPFKVVFGMIFTPILHDMSHKSPTNYQFIHCYYIIEGHFLPSASRTLSSWRVAKAGNVYLIQPDVIKLVSDLWQVCGFLDILFSSANHMTIHL